MNNKIEEQNKKVDEALKKIEHKIIVMSGKGGVGKSTIAVNIAVALSERNYKVGLMDTDLHGPNVLKMLNLESERIYSENNMLIPLKYSENLKVISMAAFLEDQDRAVIWRGPLKTGIIKQFIADVKWDELDYLVIDSPPGTGDEPLTVAQTIKDAKAIIVSTPQEISLMDVKKSITFCNQVNLKILGIIENMSYLICPKCGERIELFKSGGGVKVASQKLVNFLGSIPFELKIMESSDSGIPYFGNFKMSESGKIFEKIIEAIIANS